MKVKRYSNKKISNFAFTCYHQYKIQKLHFRLRSPKCFFFAEPSDLKKLVDKNSSSNFFIDEAPVAGEKFSTETLADISKKVSRKNYLWIACQSDKIPHKRDPNLAGNYLRLNTNKSNFQRIFSILIGLLRKVHSQFILRLF